ncbi:hypothetical protein LXL04_023936 [Taraxacum kok-saghyz]
MQENEFEKDRIGVTLSEAEKEFMGIELMDRVMKKWLPAANALFDMVTFHLPSPHVAKIYRGDKLYTGPTSDSYSEAIKDCNPDGPLIAYVSKMICPRGNKGFLAFGRVFFGRITTNMKIEILGRKFVHRGTRDVHDQFITKTAMLTSESDSWVYPIRAMRFSVYPVVRVRVECKVNEDLPKLSEALNLLAKADPAIICTVEESGIHVVTTVGDKHLEMCLNDLRNDFLNGTEVIVSEPFVAYRETVSSESSHTVISMCPNTQNRLHMEALPLNISVVGAIENGQIVTPVNPEDCKNILCEECDLHSWGFPFGCKARGLGWRSYVGGSIDLTDVVYSRAHGLDGLPSLAQRVVHASQLSAKPQLMEPFYEINIQTPKEFINTITTLLTERHGHVFRSTKMQRFGAPLHKIIAYMSVRHAFGFSTELSNASANLGHATSAQCKFNIGR